MRPPLDKRILRQTDPISSTSSNLDRSVLNAPHDCDSGLTAETLQMPRGSLFELWTVAKPYALATRLFDAAHGLAFDIERPHIGWSRGRFHVVQCSRRDSSAVKRHHRRPCRRSRQARRRDSSWHWSPLVIPVPFPSAARRSTLPVRPSASFWPATSRRAGSGRLEHRPARSTRHSLPAASRGAVREELIGDRLRRRRLQELGPVH